MFRRPRPYITNPLPDAVPRGSTMVETAEAALLEAETRLRHAAHRVERQLHVESQRTGRNWALIDFLLEMRSTLRPSAPGSEALREGPPVPIGHAAPVVVRRAS